MVIVVLVIFGWRRAVVFWLWLLIVVHRCVWLDMVEVIMVTVMSVSMSMVAGFG